MPRTANLVGLALQKSASRSGSTKEHTCLAAPLCNVEGPFRIIGAMGFDLPAGKRIRALPLKSHDLHIAPARASRIVPSLSDGVVATRRGDGGGKYHVLSGHQSNDSQAGRPRNSLAPTV